MVSIIMPAYNAEKTIKASVESVLAQIYTDWELIIIDDASVDSTLGGLVTSCNQLGKEPILGDFRITLLVNEKNAGVAVSRNRGMAHAKGELLAFLDSDDIWHVDKLAKQVAFMENKNAPISYTATSYMDANGDMYKYILHAKEQLTYKDLLSSNLMSCSSVMVKKDVMQPFPTGQNKIHEDYVVWLNILRSHKYAYGLDQPLLIYRMAEGSKSANRLSSAKMIYNAYKEVGYGAVGAGFLTLRYAVHSIGKRRMITKKI